MCVVGEKKKRFIGNVPVFICERTNKQSPSWMDMIKLNGCFRVTLTIPPALVNMCLEDDAEPHGTCFLLQLFTVSVISFHVVETFNRKYVMVTGGSS